MKIIIIGPAFPWRGGIAHHTNTLASHLKKRHDVEIITFSRQYPKLLFPGKSQYDPGDKIPDVRGLQLIDSINPLSWISTALKIRKKKPELIIFAYSIPFFGPCYGIIAALVRTFSRVKIMFLCHNIIPHERRFGDKVFTKFAFGFSDYFLVQSSSVEKDLLKLFPSAKYTNSPHPLYEMFGNSIPKEKAKKILQTSSDKIILYFGYIRPYKGLSVLLEAMKYLNDVNLLIVGEFYDSKTKYEELIKEFNIGSRVRIIADYVPNEDVPVYFSAADTVVLPYISATQSGIAQIAYNFDKPVIATDVAGLREVIVDGKTGYIVPVNNPEKLAAGIKKFYEERKEKEFSENVNVEKQKYSWDFFVTNIEKLVS
jgi:glycosyltransferase involved in cell wall biosynthesis